MPIAKKKITISLSIDLVDLISEEPLKPSGFIESLARRHYSRNGVKVGKTIMEETRGGRRRGGNYRSKVTFRHPGPTRGDIEAMLIFQSHYRPEHQLAKGAAENEARMKIKNSLTNYGKWLRVAVIDQQIVGTIGVYPVLQEAIDGVIDGTLKDSVLIPDVGGTVCYISGINILPTHRRRRKVIKGLMSEIANSIAALAPIMVYAQPATPEGLKMARKMGFTQCDGQEGAEDPMYQCYAESSAAVLQKAEARSGTLQHD